MAINVAALVSSLSIDITPFTQGLNNASKQASAFAKQINTKLTDPVKKTGIAFKDVGRIIQGIAISRVFYSALQAITSATTAVYDFANGLEYARNVYTSFFGDTALAQEFVDILKDVAVTTNVAFSQADQASRSLLSYGIEYQNLMYVLSAGINAAAAAGDPAKLQSVSDALGRIYQKGTITSNELRSLTTAGIPAYEILSEKLGLTADQLANITEQAIPASVAINAIVEGVNERFSDITNSAITTLPAIFNSIFESLKQIGAVAIQPLIQRFKELLVPVRNFLNELRQLAENGGIGAVFERIVPENLQAPLRQLIVSLLNFWDILKNILASLGRVFGSVLTGLVQLANVLNPVFNVVLGTLGALLQIITQNEAAMRALSTAVAICAGMWVIFRIQALAAAVVARVIQAISKALSGLSRALTFIVAHPFWALLILLVGVVAGLSGAFNKLGESIRNFFGNLNNIGKYDADDLLLPDQEERTKDLDKFNNALTDTSEIMDELAGATGNAVKAAKGLLSFDEVFKLNQLDENPTAPDYGWGDIDWGDAGADIGLPDLDDLDYDNWALDFVNRLIEALGGKEKLLSAGIGAILLAAIAAALGFNPLIGALIGAFVGYFWDDIAKAFGLTDVGKIALPISAALGAIIGAALGNALLGLAIGTWVGLLIDRIAQFLETGNWSVLIPPITSAIGAAIGAAFFGVPGAIAGGVIGWMVGSVIEMIIDGFRTGDWRHKEIATITGTAIGAGIGLATAGVPGAIIGGAIGALVGWITGFLINKINISDRDKVGLSLSTLIGGGIGFITGGPGGALLGGLIGNLAGWIFDGFALALEEEDWGYCADVIATGLGLGIGLIVAGPVGGAIGIAIGKVVGFILNLFISNWESIKDWASGAVETLGMIFTTIAPILGNALTPIQGVISLFGDFLREKFGLLLEWFGTLFTALGEFFGNVFTSIGEFFGNVITKVGEFLAGIPEWFGNVVTAIGAGLANIWEKVTTWFGDFIESVVTFFGNVFETIGTWLGTIWESITTWFGGLWESVIESLGNIFTSIGTFFSDVFVKITTSLSEIFSNISSWFATLISNIIQWFSNIISRVVSFFTNLFSNVTSWLSTIWGRLTGFFGDVWNGFATMMTNVWNAVKDGAANIWQTLTGWISDIWNNVFGKLFGWISDAIARLADLIGASDRAASAANNAGSRGGSRRASAIVDPGDFAGGGLDVSSFNLPGHATGGIFNTEHIARFAEGGRAEAVIPLQNASAMQPFVNAIADGISQRISTADGTTDGTEVPTQLLVGTLIADERGLRELDRRLKTIQLQEQTRRGGRS